MAIATRPLIAVLSLLALATACGGGDKGTGATTPVATTLELATAPSAGVVGTLASPTPTFVVRDQHRQPMAGVPVTVSVAGGGSLGSTATSSEAGPTPVGTWTLGTVAGVNKLTVAAGSLTPLVVSLTTAAGPTTSLTAVTPASIGGVVGQAVTARARGRDQFGNSTIGQTATITISGGGTAPSTVTADAEGIFTIPTWTLGTTPGPNTLSLMAGSAAVVFTANAVAGTPASVIISAGNSQQIFAGRNVDQPVVFTIRDQFGNGISGAPVTFAVATGGGSIGTTSGLSGPNGTVTAPAWRIGTSAVPQLLRASAGTVSGTASVTVKTSFDITVRFYGPSLPSDQMALFTAAAARISAMVVGDLDDVNAFGVDLATFCDTPGLPTLNEVLDDVVIYASIGPIDGPGKILAQAGPCATRSGGSQLPIVGIMEFDGADLATLAGLGSLQDVITHEMMHVLGIGTYWNSVGLLSGYNTSSVAYTGANAVSGCQSGGGTNTCAVTVPVENTGGAGTANGHWRESVFGSELMTGFANAGAMPISRMTIGAFLDLGYAINYDAAAAYQIPGTAAARFSLQRPTLSPPEAQWERLLVPKILISRDGKVTELQ